MKLSGPSNILFLVITSLSQKQTFVTPSFGIPIMCSLQRRPFNISSAIFRPINSNHKGRALYSIFCRIGIYQTIYDLLLKIRTTSLGSDAPHYTHCDQSLTKNSCCMLLPGVSINVLQVYFPWTQGKIFSIPTLQMQLCTSEDSGSKISFELLCHLKKIKYVVYLIKVTAPQVFKTYQHYQSL